MPTLPIQFAPLDKSADKPSMSQYNQNQRDGFWQEVVTSDGPKMIWQKRPGLTEFIDLGESQPVDGLHYWVRQQKVIGVTNQKIFRVDSTPTKTDVTGTATMTALVRPTFADVLGTNLYAANSGQIAAIPAASAAAYLTDGDAPTSVRFIAALNRKLIALNDSAETFEWSEPSLPDDWQGQTATVEGSPDLAKSMHAANAYLYFHGQDSIEIWRDDATTFVREGPGAIARGTIAAYSVTNINGAFYWLDENREIFVLNGFTPTLISNPVLSRYLKTFGTVNDAKGDYLKIEGRHFYVLSFPTEAKTLVYDIALRMWYEWGYWNNGTASYEEWKGNCITDAIDWNKILVGDNANSKIYEVSGTTDDGDTIRTVLATDAIDRGRPDINKFCSELTLVFKRADTNTTPKTMSIYYRDDGEADWGTAKTAGIEAQSTTDLVYRVRRLGKYKKRNWQFVMSDASASALLDVYETFDYGRR